MSNASGLAKCTYLRRSCAAHVMEGGIEAQIAKKLSVCSLIELILDDGILLICRYR